MKVILKGYVDNLGDAGDIVEVANGYATNYLIPQNLALRASKGAIADAEALRRSRLRREAVEIEAAEEQAKGLTGRLFMIEATAGEDGTLYGSVGKRDIADAVKRVTGLDIDAKRVDLVRPIKHVGQEEVGLILHREVVAMVTIDVVADEVIESGAEELEEALKEDGESDADVSSAPAYADSSEDTDVDA